MNVEVEGNAKTTILSLFMDWLRYEPNKANRIIKLCTKMPISEVHACWPPKYVYGLFDLSIEHECGGGRER